MRVFWYRTDDGSHFATPKWTLHAERDDGWSRCGLVKCGPGTLDGHFPPQGECRACQRCFKDRPVPVSFV